MLTRTNTAASALSRPRPLLHTAWRGLVGSRRAASMLFKANLRSRQRRAIGGYLWLILPGIALALTFSLLRQGSLFATGDVSLPYPLFALSGIFLWQGFIDGLGGPLQNLTRERQFLAVTTAPQEAVILAGLLENLVALSIRMTLLGIAMALFRLMPDPTWLLLPLAAVAMLLAGLGIGMMIAPIGQLFDDVSAMIGILSGFGLFLLPVIYPIPETSILAWNPLVSVIDAAHAWMAGEAAPSSLIPIAVLICIGLPAGWLATAIARPHLAARSS